MIYKKLLAPKRLLYSLLLAAFGLMVLLLPGVKAAEITGVSFGVQVGNQAYNYTTDDYNSLRPETERVNSILEDVNPLPLFINTSETPGAPSESFTPIQNPYTQLGTVFNLVSSNPGY